MFNNVKINFQLFCVCWNISLYLDGCFEPRILGAKRKTKRRLDAYIDEEVE